ncbi:uncharacterized protein LOC21406716 [Morus notabilis]|uniref:uncharacterized protein LOC21406716 n=1 Tax=Morus notabilis TaxID=981085 RepID=UPI000CED503A|nr:uncharacterized protein LOC21406716 [Morus notabilis]
MTSFGLMDWYSANGIDDLIVPKDGGLSDRLPSPDSWSKWGVGVMESYPSHNKGGSAFRQKFTAEEPDFRSLYDDVEMEDFVDKCHSSISSACGRLSDDSVQRTTLSSNRPDYQLDLGGSRQMDDIFLSSLLEDLPEIENQVKSFCFSPKSQRGTQSNNFLTDMTLDSENTSSGAQCLSSSRYLQTHVFSPSLGLENEDTTASKFVSSQQKDFSPSKGTSLGVSVPSKENRMSIHMNEETSLEESVLQELKMVTNQLTEKTRICFRDALYRLANNSKQHHMTQNQDGDLCVGIPPLWTPNHETTRSETKKATESETNVIDRAVANLIFNNSDFNKRDLSMAASSNSKEEVGGATESSDNQLYQTQIRYLDDHQVVLDDAQVPNLGHTNPYPAANSTKSFSKKGCRELDFNVGLWLSD